MRVVAFACVALAGCARAEIPSVRFANAPAVAAVDDRRDVATPPAKRLYLRELYFLDAGFYRPIVRALELSAPRRALGVNALDEVPDSTWFTNRIGARALSPDEIRTGPVTSNPEDHKPWTIRSTKIGGTALGYIVTDTSGVKYMLKFDGAGDPAELQTGTDVAVNRLLWACGYNVAEDQVVYFAPGELLLAPDAAVKDADGTTTGHLDAAALARGLATVRREKDGRIRALASRWISGVTLGSHPGEGVRGDDPNDTIPHELRRDLRGQTSIYAWLDAIDVTEGQYVDTWIADPREPTHHYLKHYAIDFGMSLGAMGGIDHDWWHSSGYLIDFPQIARMVLTLGLGPRPWQDRSAPALVGVAPLLEADTFDPGTWQNDLSGYLPFRTADRIDKFWGAKIVARFTRAQIRAAVEAGRFTDPRAVDYITDTLLARQRVTEAYWFARVDPLDRFAMEARPDGDAVCFDDLAITSALVAGATTSYALDSYDFAGHRIATRAGHAAAEGRTCLQPALAARDADGGYTIVRITTVRPTFAGETFVHIAREPVTGATRVIGVWRP